MCESCQVTGPAYTEANMAITSEAGAAMKAPALPQVQSAVERAEVTTSYIEQALDILVARLDAVSLYYDPSDGGYDEPEPLRAPLAQRLEHNNDRLARVRDRLTAAISALEV